MLTLGYCLSTLIMFPFIYDILRWRYMDRNNDNTCLRSSDAGSKNQLQTDKQQR